jgi:hypothetical protein
MAHHPLFFSFPNDYSLFRGGLNTGAVSAAGLPGMPGFRYFEDQDFVAVCAVDGAAITAQMSAGIAADVTGAFETPVRFFPAPAVLLHFHSDFFKSCHPSCPSFITDRYVCFPPRWRG